MPWLPLAQGLRTKFLCPDCALVSACRNRCLALSFFSRRIGRDADSARIARIQDMDHRQLALGLLPTPKGRHRDRHGSEVWHHLDAADRELAGIPGCDITADWTDLAL